MTRFLSRWHLAVLFLSPHVSAYQERNQGEGCLKGHEGQPESRFFHVKPNGSFVDAKNGAYGWVVVLRFFQNGGPSLFCWETLRIVCGVDVACTNFWLNGKNICKENDGFREMVNQLLAILFIHESTLEALQLLMHHTLGQERSRGHYLWWHAWQRIPQCSWIHHCSAWM